MKVMNFDFSSSFLVKYVFIISILIYSFSIKRRRGEKRREDEKRGKDRQEWKKIVFLRFFLPAGLDRNLTVDYLVI